VDLRVVVWIRECLVGRTQRVRVGGKLSKEVKVTSGVPHESVLGPLLFLMYDNAIWRNIDPNIRLFADECKIHRKITNKNDIRNLQKDLDTLGEWAAENGMKIIPGKRKAIRFTRARVKNPLGHSLGDLNIQQANSCKYLGIILRSDLKWVDQVNYLAQKARKALRCVMHVLNKENRTTKSLAYTSLVVLLWNTGLHVGIRVEKNR
jgi:hypothetical protein